MQTVHNHYLINELTKVIQVIPITDAIDTFAKEKISLEKKGTPMHDNFDLLIAATALTFNYILVTNNTKHFSHFSDLILEDWTQK